MGTPRMEWKSSVALLKGLKHGEALVLDLMACARPQWGGEPSSSFHREDGFLDHNWIWCALPNFGGRIGMYGKPSELCHRCYKSRASSQRQIRMWNWNYSRRYRDKSHQL